MLFSFTVRAVYVESCSMFVRGGVYRVVKEALGGTLAKMSVSALMFDYILTGPISGVSAGQYIAGLINDVFVTLDTHGWVPRAVHAMFHGTPHVNVNWTSVVFAAAVTVYFWWQNTKGIQESSEKALRVMQITTVMVVLLLGWSAITLLKQGYQPVPLPTGHNLQLRLYRPDRVAVRDDHPRFSACSCLQGQPDRRPGHVLMGPANPAPRVSRIRGSGWIPDSLRRREHRHHRLQWRPESSLRRRSPARLVPSAPPAFRHDLSHRQPGRISPAIYDSGQSRKRVLVG